MNTRTLLRGVLRIAVVYTLSFVYGYVIGTGLRLALRR